MPVHGLINYFIIKYASSEASGKPYSTLDDGASRAYGPFEPRDSELAITWRCFRHRTAWRAAALRLASLPSSSSLPNATTLTGVLKSSTAPTQDALLTGFVCPAEASSWVTLKPYEGLRSDGALLKRSRKERLRLCENGTEPAFYITLAYYGIEADYISLGGTCCQAAGALRWCRGCLGYLSWALGKCSASRAGIKKSPFLIILLNQGDEWSFYYGMAVSAAASSSALVAAASAEHIA